MKTLLKYAHNSYSQNGEDGILKEIFKRLAIEVGWFVEFGAWDGKHMSNTYALLEKGWSGIDIEGEVDRYQDLLKTAKKFPKKLYTINSFVARSGKNSLDNLLKPTPLPRDFALLSIDIDSYDWYTWKSLKNYNPKVVVIEVNSGIPLHKEYVQPYGVPYEKLLAKGQLSGSSFTSMLKLGEQKGYKLASHTGNMIFVRKNLVDKLKLPAEELENPSTLFIDTWVEKKPPLKTLLDKFKKISSR